MQQVNRASPLFFATVVFSSFLLFLVEPLIGQQILPWFGGAAAVWATCLVFYQTALLAGYSYAAWFGHHRRVHLALLISSLALLPVGPSTSWSTVSSAHPIFRILAMLTLSTGVPFVLLSATSPLLQRWLADRGVQTPYWLFIVSNAASLAGLFAYPLVVEPFWNVQQQRWIWSGCYLVFASLSAFAAWKRAPVAETSPGGSNIALREAATWFALAAVGSMLLLSVTNHLTTNVAPVPFLWILPLAVYLITFMLGFTRFAGTTTLWSGMAIFGLVLLANTIYDIEAVEPVQITIPVVLFGLFSGCLFCHSQLYLRRPSPESLTTFYIAIAAGGAAGSIFVGILAPQIFTGISELPCTMLLLALLATAITWRNGASHRLLWTGVSVGMTAVLYMNVIAFAHSSLAQRRSFYGALRVVQSGLGEHQIRTLFHGTIEHGAQFLLPPWRERPTTYYGPDSGIGITLRECMPKNKRVGVIGLGTGTLAAYGEAGDRFRFYEINPQVLDLATSLFFYLRESKAQITTQIGDARLSLQSETQTKYDALVIDAFSGDAIPVHLLSREALQLYRHHLDEKGVIAFHVSNNFLDLASIVNVLATDAGMSAALIRNHDDPEAMILASDWVLVTHNHKLLENSGLKLHRVEFSSRPGLPVWTDSYNNLLQILKTPTVR